MRGGLPLSWIRPLDPTGNAVGASGEHLIGTYRGHFESWNLTYLRPGYTARYVHKKKVAQRKREGWKVATPEDARQYEGELSASGAIESENLILLVAPIALIEERAKLRREQSRQADKAATDKFLTDRVQGEAEASDGRPIRFQTSDHGSAG
jgi:hypothetical protein